MQTITEQLSDLLKNTALWHKGAIDETRAFFIKHYGISYDFDYIYLENRFNEYKVDFEVSIKRSIDFIETGRRQELFKEVSGFYDSCDEGRNEYLPSKVLVRNSSDTVAHRKAVAEDYYTFALFANFHKERLKIIRLNDARLIGDPTFLLKLKGSFEGKIFRPGYTETEFLDFFREGVKQEYIPIMDRALNTFVYILFDFIIPENKLPLKTLEDALNISDLKGKRNKLNKKTIACIEARRIIKQL